MAFCLVFSIGATAQQLRPAATAAVTTTGGTNGQIALFNGPSSITNSIVYQTAAGIGINRIPQATLDVNGLALLRGDNYITGAKLATPAAGGNSHPLRFVAEAYNSSSKAVVQPYFQLQSEPTGNNSNSPGAIFTFLYNNGTGSSPAETGLYFNPDGTIHFSSAQTFPITQAPKDLRGQQVRPVRLVHRDRQVLSTSVCRHL